MPYLLVDQEEFNQLRDAAHFLKELEEQTGSKYFPAKVKIKGGADSGTYRPKLPRNHFVRPGHKVIVELRPLIVDDR